MWVRTDRLLATRCVQRLPSGNTLSTLLQSWLLNAGGTAIAHVPAYTALLVRNAAHPVSQMRLSRWGLRTRLRTCTSSREIVS